MDFKTIVPDRYNDRPHKYKYINVFQVYKGYVKLLIVERASEKTMLAILLQKGDLDRVSGYHWGGTKGWRPPCAHIDKKCLTIGQYVSGSGLRVCGKIKGKPLWDLRRDRYSATGNDYVSLGKGLMKLVIYRREGPPYSVIFDGEDRPLLSKHTWRAEKDNRGAYSVVSRDNNRQLSMHAYLLKAHGQKPGKKGFRNIESENYQFDFRKQALLKKHALNIYTILNSTTVELTINSVHGPIKIIFDKKDHKKVSGITWTYKRHGLAWVVRNYKLGLLKQFILGPTDKKYLYIDEKKDKSGRLDFRRKTLLKGLR